MASVTRERTLLVPTGPASPSRESTYSTPADPSSARMRILVAPYYSPYIVSFEKAQTWEGLIVTLQRLFGPTFCSMALPPTITIYETDDAVNADNWERFAHADCSIVVHTKSEDTRKQPSPKPETSGPTTIRDRLAPRSRDGPKTEISNPKAVSSRENRPRLINRHANVGYDTPNMFDGGQFAQDNETSPRESQPKRKRRGTLWNTVLNVISIVNLSSSSSQPAQQPLPPPEPVVSQGPVTHISAMARTNSRKLSQRRRAKSKRSSRVIMQAPTTVSRQPSQTNSRQPLRVRLAAGNIMRISSKRQVAKRRSIQPPSKEVRRHIAKAGSDCSTCFGDDKNRDSVIMVARLAGAGSRQPVVISASAPVSSQSSPRSRNPNAFMVADRPEKADSITIFSSPIIEEFSLQPKRKCRPPSSAAATKTSSLYYEHSAPPVPKRSSTEDTGFTAQYKLLDEKIVRSAVYKAAAARKAEEKHKAEEQHPRSNRSSQRSGETSPSAKSTQSNKTTFSERAPRSSTVAPKRSRSMGPAVTDPRSPAALRRSETASPSVKSKNGSGHVTIDSYNNAKHAKHPSTGSRAGAVTARSNGTRSSAGGFVRQSTPFDNKPLPKLPDEALANAPERRSKTSASGVVVTGPIATFEDLMSGTASSISESAEINSITQVTLVAGHPELR
ncbi:hypothetical protein Dda_7810 [Drechslerella dactyloides]|uniref:Uncharacterized protein n=1 Tax=Drechslerella dactyloides TaxID=74499 RepID=A0AAD6NG75_DREDA|nr:hypothetical protein Dda_7810 [Drechslerella dactyloides]